MRVMETEEGESDGDSGRGESGLCVANVSVLPHQTEVLRLV